MAGKPDPAGRARAAAAAPDACTPGASPARDTIDVEVAWVGENGLVQRRALRLVEPATLDDALRALAAPERDALRERIADGTLQTAVFGELREGGARLLAGDRVELLAGLAVDPRVARRLRVQHRRAALPGNKWCR